MKRQIYINPMAIFFALAMFTAAPYADAAQTVNFDQGVEVSDMLEAARRNVREMPASTVSATPVKTVAAGKSAAPKEGTYSEGEVLRAIADLGGDISGSFADIIAAVFKKSGRPSGIIVGDEIQGSFIVGWRQGSGKVKFKSGPGSRPQKIRWRAPSIGFNIGASANKVTILVYNTRDYESLMQAFVSLQGSFHFILGGGITYMQEVSPDSGKAPIRLAHVAVGVGFDAGVAIEGLSFRRD